MNNSHHRLFGLMWLVAVSSLLATQSQADPLPGENLLKFSQQPMNTTFIQGQVYGGHDEISTAYGVGTAAQPPQDYQGTFMADDFADNFTSPVVHVKWWGSYHADFINPNLPVNKFLIAFESDVPQNPGVTFSQPGSVLQFDVVNRGALAPGSGTFTEKLIRGPDPVFGESLYEYNAELHLSNQFAEQAGKVYWLKIAALIDTPTAIPIPAPPNVTQWGWHNRDYTIQDTLASAVPSPGEYVDGQIAGQNIYHFQDDAVTGNLRFLPFASPSPVIFQTNMSPTFYVDNADGPGGSTAGTPGISSHSKDLAFELYTYSVPEPAACLLMAIGLVGVSTIRRRSCTA